MRSSASKSERCRTAAIPEVYLQAEQMFRQIGKGSVEVAETVAVM